MGITAYCRSYPHSPQPLRRHHARVFGLSLSPARWDDLGSYFYHFLVLTKGSTIVHDCPHCGLILGRDHNAAINILALGLQSVNAGLPDEVVEAQEL
jgi:hypothetical protein